MQFQSILEILLITNKSGKSKKTNNDYSINEAHCILRNADGTPGAVGVLVIPKTLEEKAKQGGTYTASFGLTAGGFGENQGRIIAVLTDLNAVPPGAFKAAPAPAPAPAPSAAPRATAGA